MTQITVLSGVKRRRHWSDERKLALVEVAIIPGAPVAAIACDADVSPSSIYRWRRNLHVHLYLHVKVKPGWDEDRA